MDAITPWLTPALLVALFAWLRLDIRELRRDLNQRIDKTEKRIDELAKDINKRFDDVNKRFDDVNRELAGQRERMAKLEGSLEGSSPADVTGTPPDAAIIGSASRWNDHGLALLR